MNFIAKLSHISVDFTPDEWEQVKRIGDFSVAHVEEINAKGYEESPEKLNEVFAHVPKKEKVPCTCTKYYKYRQWIDPDCKGKHSY